MAGRVEQRRLGVLVVSYLLGKDLLVPAERYCVDTGAGVFFHSQVLHASHGCKVKLGVECDLTLDAHLVSRVPSHGQFWVSKLSVCDGTVTILMLSW